MAKFTVRSSGFQLCPEGRRVFKINEVDDSNYEKFGDIEIKLQDKKGNQHKETFKTVKANCSSQSSIHKTPMLQAGFCAPTLPW